MNDEQLLRYSRHILLDEIGIDGQERLNSAHALVIGAGGLGSPVALYLASAGIGTLTICDGDVVDLTNLQRQIVHRVAAVGTPKAVSAQKTLAGINPETKVNAVTERVSGERMSALVKAADVVLDCSDNFATRHALNRACVAHSKQLVSGAGVRFDGQITVFDRRDRDAPRRGCGPARRAAFRHPEPVGLRARTRSGRGGAGASGTTRRAALVDDQSR